MDESKKEQAMRLFEAMEGVDPLLLERSEKAKKVVPIWKYTRMVAACLALLAVGGLSWYSLMVFGRQSSNGATCEAPSAVTDNSGKAAAPNQYYDAVEQNICGDAAASSMDDYDRVEAEEYKNADEATQNPVVTENEEKLEANTVENSVRGDRYHFKTMIGNTPNIREDVEEYLSDKTVTVQVGSAEAEERELEYTYAALLYMYLTELEIVPADASEGEGFEADVILRITDQQEGSSEVWMIDGSLLRYEGLSDIYEIVDERFDPDTFPDDLGHLQ